MWPLAVLAGFSCMKMYGRLVGAKFGRDNEVSVLTS